MPVNLSSDATRIIIRGYLPANRNQLKGAHWSAIAKEKKRAMLALSEALRELAALESLTESSPAGPLTGTITPSRKFRIASSRLAYWLETNGHFLRVESSPKRFQRPKKNGQKS